MILGTMFLLAGTLVYALGGNDPTVMGHTMGEIALPKVTQYHFEGSGNPGNYGQLGPHDLCFLSRVIAHDDDHDSRRQGCALAPSTLYGEGMWTKYVYGTGGISWCTAICLDWE